MTGLIGKVFFVLLLTLLLAACGQPASTPEPAEAAAASTEETTEDAGAASEEEMAEPERGSLVGTAWELAFFGEPDNPVPPIEGTAPTFNILFERYAGNGGCNMYMAGFVVGSADELRLNAPVTTGRACSDPEGVMEQESTFIGAIPNTVAARMEGDNLVLFTVGDQRLMTLAPIESIDMAATTWTLQFMSDGEDLMPVLPHPDAQVTAQFADSAVSGSAGCNEYTGTVEADMESNSVTISGVAATEMACEEPDDVMEQETAYLAALEASAGFDLVGRNLMLLDSDGEPILLYSGQ